METLGTSQTNTNDPIKGTFTTTVDMKKKTPEETNGCIGSNSVSDPKLNEVQLNQPKQETLEEAAEIVTTTKFSWQQERMYSQEEVELIANEMVNWAIDNIGNPNPKSGKKFDEVIAKFKKK